MQAYVLKKHGSPNVLQVQEVPTPLPGKQEVRVRIEYIGLNYAEILSRKGLYGWAPKLPYIPGMEAYGTLDVLGSNVKNRQIGEKVIVAAQYGCYSEYVVVHEDLVLPAMADLTAQENAAFAVNYMTAWIALFKLARLQPEDSVLIQAASGGVGTAALNLARSYGSYLYATAGTDEKVRYLQKLGAHTAINYCKEDFERVIREKTKGVDVIIEMIGGNVFKKSLRLLLPFGRIIVMGFASFNLNKMNPLSWIKTWRDIPRCNISDMSTRSYGIMSSHLGYLLPNTELMHKTWLELVTYTLKHQIHPLIGSVFPFKKMAEAHTVMQSRRHTGKIVIQMH